MTKETDADEFAGDPPPAGLSAPGPAPPWTIDDYEEAAIRGRLAARMFGAEASAVKIGRYEVGDRIGHGGMGEVYSARDPELGRLVALKLLPSRRSDDPRHRQRLLGEARTLARLSHPNVVQIHEVGVHEGSVFLALELIEGETLESWQARPGRRWQEILAAYVDAARGLAAAHEIGIVHRDVKPSNILVGIDGRVRVVDFGLARAAEGVSDATTLHTPVGEPSESTSTGVIVGTPAYMSPEQAGGRDIDARSDQFSLCVALFEGLYGLRPFGPRELRERVTVDAPLLRRLIPASATAPAWVLTILVRGLQFDPARRHPDMRALIAALEETPRRRANRRLLLAGGLALALGGVVAFALRGPDTTCPQVAAVAPGFWDSASRAAIRENLAASGLPFAGSVWRQVERSFDSAVLAWSRERRAACEATWIERTWSEDQFRRSSACLAGFERQLRSLSLRLRTDTNTRLVGRAHELVRDLGDPGRCRELAVDELPAPVASASAVALRERLDALKVSTRLAEFKRALEIADEVLAAPSLDGPLHVEALYRKAIVLHRSGELADAARLFDEAEALAEDGRDDRLAAAIFGEQTELATRGTRELARARVYARLYGAKLRRIGGDDAAWADYHDRLGELELLAGNYSAALEQHTQAEKLRAPLDLVGRARSAGGAANALAELGRGEEAMTRLLDARTLVAGELGGSHPDVAVIDMNIGLSLLERGELERGRDILRSAVEAEERAVGPDDIGVARSRSGLALAHLELGDLELALAEAERARATLSRTLPPTHDDIREVLKILANVHTSRRRWPAASAVVHALMAAHRAAGEPIPPELHVNAGEYFLRQGLISEATPQFDQALSLLAVEASADPQLLAHALNGRAKVHLEHGQPESARRLCERALELIADASQRSELRAELLAGLAQALWRTGGGRSEARRLAREALDLFATLDGAEDAAVRLRRLLGIR